MQKLYAALKEADGLVLDTPVYMGQMSAQAKIFTDRLFAQITPRFSPRFKEDNANRKLAIVFTQGNPDADKFKVYFDYARQMFRLLEFDVKDTVIMARTRTESACSKKRLFSELITAGANLVV
jgi:multimeric flavodoxin WrbA